MSFCSAVMVFLPVYCAKLGSASKRQANAAKIRPKTCIFEKSPSWRGSLGLNRCIEAQAFRVVRRET